MTLPSSSQDNTLRIYLSLAQYPILSTDIRSVMRRELFERGVITQQAFETEVQEKAIRSQLLEGLNDPLLEEPGDVWETRLARIRDYVTDFYFAYNLPFDLFETILRKVLADRGKPVKETLITFNPELAPQRYLFEQGFLIEKLPIEERKLAEARLQEIKVVLIRTLISDQLAYVNIAKDWFKLSDLSNIKKRKIGRGKIGGKAAGMMLAYRILREVGDEETCSSVCIPDSYFIGADIMYDFMARNGLMHWLDQKYKSEEEIRHEYPALNQDFLNCHLPPEALEKLRLLLDEVQQKPLIVRSSSLLEDNFGMSFAGKYESHFCPNQAPPEENLKALEKAIIKIYASIFNADALLYRRAKGLQNYDERMAILLQVVQGEKLGRYYLPQAAGVAYSQNLYRWMPQIRSEDGFMRLVWGLGTRAVDRIGNDYTRMVALSHPTLHPEASVKLRRRYSQQFVDVIDLQDNEFKTLPIQEVITRDYPPIRYLAEVDDGDVLVPFRSKPSQDQLNNLVLTFDELFRRFPLAKRMNNLLQILEKQYKSPVDTEFTIQITDTGTLNPQIKIYLLQCRPQALVKEDEANLPVNLREDDIIFSTPRMVPKGRVRRIDYVIFIDPEAYFRLTSPTDRANLGRVVGALNARLADENFICAAPGRWGTSNPDLGIHVGYGDIYNTRALIEITGQNIGSAPDPSYGTHFFQDLVESNIYPLAIYLDDDEAVLNQAFFYKTPNNLNKLLPTVSSLENVIRVIKVSDYRARHHIEVVMDNQKKLAIAFLAKDQV